MKRSLGKPAIPAALPSDRRPISKSLTAKSSRNSCSNCFGVETVTLSEAQTPSHNHTARADETNANLDTPSDTTAMARSFGGDAYQTNTSANLVDMASQTLGTTGGSQSHTNVQPYLTLNFIIALVGLYPSRG